MKRLVIAVLAGLIFLPTAVRAAEEPAASGRPPEPAAKPARIPALADRYFVGYETEPAMDAYARTLISTEAGLSRFVGTLLPSRRFAPLYELPLALVVSTIAHERGGHGSRGREFDLDPTFTFASTSLKRDPETNLQLIAIGTGGTEESSVMSHRILQDLYEGDGADGSKIPLLLWAKTDLSTYVALTPDPASDPHDFQDEYENGNDIAFTIATRQAHRRHADPVSVWEGDYTIDADDPILRDTYRDVRAAAIWNMIDPAFLSALASYAWDYCGKSTVRVRPRSLPLGTPGYGLTVGTRAFLGAQDVSRYLDLYIVTPGPLVRLSGRDITSSIDRAYGGGAGIVGLPLARGVEANLSADAWSTPESAEGFYQGTGWNVAGELDVLFAGHLGFSVKVGAKSEGYFPAAPLDAGAYGGAGILFSF